MNSMQTLNVPIYILGNGFAGYETNRDFVVIERGLDFEEIAVDLIARDLERFSDSEIFAGTMAEVFMTDQQYYRSFRIITGGKWSESGMDGFRKDMENFGDFLRANIENSSASWHVCDAPGDY